MNPIKNKKNLESLVDEIRNIAYKYIEKFRILENPETLDIVCKEMAELFKNKGAEIVLSAAIGGILLCGGVGYHLGLKHIFAERIDGQLCLRRGFDLPDGIKVLIVEDIVTTGGSIFELIQLSNNYKANIVGICSLVDRSLNENNFQQVFKSKHRLDYFYLLLHL